MSFGAKLVVFILFVCLLLFFFGGGGGFLCVQSHVRAFLPCRAQYWRDSLVATVLRHVLEAFLQLLAFLWCCRVSADPPSPVCLVWLSSCYLCAQQPN
jgi:hypothetical protein